VFIGFLLAGNNGISTVSLNRNERDGKGDCSPSESVIARITPLASSCGKPLEWRGSDLV
jgi:hypothetical protein